MIDVVIFIAFVLIVLFYLVRKPHGYPPGPFRTPVLGYVTKVDPRLPYKTWDKLRSKYGEIIGLYFGLEPTVIVNGWEAVKEGLNNEDLNSRPNSVFLKDLTEIRKTLTVEEVSCGFPVEEDQCVFGRNYSGVMFNTGEAWKFQKRFALVHMKNLGFGKRSHEVVIHEEVEELVKEIKEKNEEPFMSQVLLGISGVNILWAIVGGERFSRKDERLSHLVRNLTISFRASQISGGVVNFFPFLRHLFPNISEYRTVIKGFLEIKDFIMSAVKEHRSTWNKDDMRDFIDVYIKEMDTNNNKDPSFTDDQLVSVCRDIFTAGTETSSSFLTFAIMFLCLHPDIQKKVQMEIDSVVARDRLPSLDDKSKLVYTEAFLQEVLRIRCPAPHTVPHMAYVDTQLQGYRIPKDTVVLFNIRSVLMDKDYWGDPENFRPERFIHDGKLKKEERMIPFGKGRRICLGEALARMTSYYLFAGLVQNFSFKFPPGQILTDTEGIAGFTLGPPSFEIIATPRP